MLSIPVKKHGAWRIAHGEAHTTQDTKIFYKDVKIDYNQNWLKNHWNAIQSAYGKAPYFEFYAEFFREILFKKIKYLFDLNIEMLDLCLKLLQVKCGIEFTESFNKMPADSTCDMRNVIHPISKLSLRPGFIDKNNPKTYLSLRASRLVKGMERSNLQKKESKHLFKPHRYQQIFGNKFAANLSIIDLLFCEGGDALRVLQKSEIISEP